MRSDRHIGLSVSSECRLRQVFAAVYHGWVVSPANSQAIVVTGLRKGFGDWPVLWDLDLTVEWGQFLVIFGANGVGKTTLLKILSTQARPDAGQVSVGGFERSQDPRSIRRIIGAVPHRSLIYEDMTCQENLRFFARLYQVPQPERRIGDVLNIMGLEGRRNSKAGTLSNGMQKRLSIARAILHEPKILLMDEPEAGLDQEALDMLGSLLEGWSAEGRSVVMTTHNVEQGLAWGDRVAILSGGKMAYDEPKTALDAAAFRGVYQRCLEAVR